jgi:hypothetical protein
MGLVVPSAATNTTTYLPLWAGGGCWVVGIGGERNPGPARRIQRVRPHPPPPPCAGETAADRIVRAGSVGGVAIE